MTTDCLRSITARNWDLARSQADIAETESEIDSLRKQFEAVREAVDEISAAERGNATAAVGIPASEEQERRKKKFMLTRQCDRLRAELGSKEADLRTLLQHLRAIQRPPSAGPAPAPAGHDERRAGPPPPVVPEAVKDMCEYLGINVFQARPAPPPPRPRAPPPCCLQPIPHAENLPFYRW